MNERRLGLRTKHAGSERSFVTFVPFAYRSSPAAGEKVAQRKLTLEAPVVSMAWARPHFGHCLPNRNQKTTTTIATRHHCACLARIFSKIASARW